MRRKNKLEFWGSSDQSGRCQTRLAGLRSALLDQGHTKTPEDLALLGSSGSGPAPHEGLQGSAQGRAHAPLWALTPAPGLRGRRLSAPQGRDGPWASGPLAESSQHSRAPGQGSGRAAGPHFPRILTGDPPSTRSGSRPSFRARTSRDSAEATELALQTGTALLHRWWGPEERNYQMLWRLSRRFSFFSSSGSDVPFFYNHRSKFWFLLPKGGGQHDGLDPGKSILFSSPLWVYSGNLL